VGTTRSDILNPFDRPQSAGWMIRFRRIGSREGDQKTEFSTLPASTRKILKKRGQGKRVSFYRETTKNDLRMGLLNIFFDV
jgi:hypothetical protein